MKFNKVELANKIREATNLSNEDKSSLLQLLNEKKTYGLVWEDSTEDAWEMMKESVPVLKEDVSKRIENGSENPNHILIEGDNLNALTALTYTHEGKIDVIYIDPPYNSGARDWKYNNDYVDINDNYRHSHWLSMMKHRLVVAKRLLKPDNSVLMVTIDEKEYLHLGCLLEELFPSQRMQMVSVNIHPGGVARDQEFARSDEYIFFVYVGDAGPLTLELNKDWLFGIEKTSRDRVHWRALLRSGSNDSRQHSPGCFYPIFVSENGDEIVSIGEPLSLEQDRNSVVAPEGTKAIFPIHANGKEGCWQCSPQILQSLCERGYVKLGGFTKRGMSINYLAKGEQNKVEAGLFKILGKNKDGSLILDDEGYKPRFIPTTQWNVKSHDALRNGTGLLNSILGPKVFSYPKSLYAVRDCLRFFVDDKKDAIVFDFFAGSGTTLHATMQLNADDGGHRQCILVTNNENNICEEVTYERNKRVIEGYTKPNGEFVEGLHDNNLRYFKVDFTSREKNHQQDRELFRQLTDLIRIQDDVYQEQNYFGTLSLTGKEKMIRYFSENGRMSVMIYDARVIPYLVREIEKMKEQEFPVIKIYVFADGSYPYTAEFESVLGQVELIPMPYAYQRAIKHALPETESTWVDNTNLTEEEKAQMMKEAIQAENEEKN